jgi:hypothetical protein
MLDELQRRNYAKSTVRSYIHAVEDFAKVFQAVTRLSLQYSLEPLSTSSVLPFPCIG